MTAPFRFLLPTLAALALTGCSPDPQELYASARAHVAAEDYRAARSELQEALHQEPRNQEMLLLLARLQLQLGDGEGADATITRLQALGLKGAGIAQMRAEATLHQGKAKEALALLGSDNTPAAWRIRAAARAALDDMPGAKAAYLSGLGAGDDFRLVAAYTRFLLAGGDVEGAAVQLATLRRLRPNGIDAMLLAGDIAAQQGRTADALADYRRAAARFPFRAEPLMAQAEQLSAQGKVDDALKALEQADGLEPGHPRVEALKIQFYSEKGQWDKVRDLLQRREADLDPNSADGLTYGEALLRMGHPEQARMLFTRSVLVAPENRYARMMLGEAQLATGDAAAAWRTLKPLVAGVMVNPRELELAERAARSAGDPAADSLRARLQSAELRDQSLLAGKGQGAMIRRDWPAAIAAFEQLLQAGDDPEILRRLAFACSQAGRHDAAIGYADRALALQPESAELKYLGGVTRLTASRDLPAAVALLQQAVEARPDNATYKADLAKAEAAAG